jgi:hypothetical protein
LKLLELEPRRSSGASLGSWLGSTLWLCPAELRALCTFYGLSALPFPTFDHCANQLILHASRIQHDDKVCVCGVCRVVRCATCVSCGVY